MFEWMAMYGNYEQRNVDTYECSKFTIDTSYVTDRSIPYECAISHKDFNHGEWIILGWAPSKSEAQMMHDKFVEHFKNSEIEEIQDAYTKEVFKRKK